MFLFLQFIRKQDEFRPIVQCRGKKNKVGLKVFLTLEGEKWSCPPVAQKILYIVNNLGSF